MIAAFGAAGFGAFAEKNRDRPAPRRPCATDCLPLCNASALGAPRRAGFDLLRSNALPLRSPTTPRKRCPLARGLAERSAPCAGFFRFFGAFPMRRPKAAPPLRVDRRPGEPPAGYPLVCSPLRRVPPLVACLSRRASRFVPRLRYGSGLIDQRDPPPPLSTYLVLRRLYWYLVHGLRWLSPCPAAGLGGGGEAAALSGAFAPAAGCCRLCAVSVLFSSPTIRPCLFG